MAKYILAAILVLGLAGAHAAGGTSTLSTPSFTIKIKQNCPEGEVSCESVTYEGTSNKTGKAIKLRGKTLHSMCADGKTPCKLQGYEFKNGKTAYTILESGELTVTYDGKTLVHEQGRWSN